MNRLNKTESGILIPYVSPLLMNRLNKTESGIFIPCVIAQSDQSSLSAWSSTEPLATKWAHREGSGQTGQSLILILTLTQL